MQQRAVTLNVAQQASVNINLPFGAVYAQVSNQTNQYLVEGNSQQVIPPGVFGYGVLLNGASQNAQLAISQAQPQVSPPLGSATITYYDQQYQPSSGSIPNTLLYQQTLLGPISGLVTNLVVPIPPWVQGIRLQGVLGGSFNVTVVGAVSGEALVIGTITGGATIDALIASSVDTSVLVSTSIGGTLYVVGLPFSPSFFIENDDAAPVPSAMLIDASGTGTNFVPVEAQSAGANSQHAAQVGLTLLRSSDSSAVTGETTYQQSAGNTGAGVLAADRLLDSWTINAQANGGAGAVTATQASPGAGLQLVVTTISAKLSDITAAVASTSLLSTTGLLTTQLDQVLAVAASVGWTDTFQLSGLRLLCKAATPFVLSLSDTGTADSHLNVFAAGFTVAQPQA